MGGDLKLLTADANGVLTLGISRPPTRISGIDKLVQIVVLTFLSNGNRSIENPGRGGGLRMVLGSNYDPSDPSELYTDISMIISHVEQTIQTEQVSTTRPPSEQLSMLQLVDITIDSEGNVAAAVGVMSADQQVLQAVVPIS